MTREEQKKMLREINVSGVSDNQMRSDWLAKPTAGHDTHGQTAVYEEGTGKDVAIVYDGARDGNLIAAAPDLLAACKDALSQIAYLRSKLSDKERRFVAPTTNKCEEGLIAAIARAEGS